MAEPQRWWEDPVFDFAFNRQTKSEFTGYGEDGVLQPNKPVSMIDTNQGVRMIHEGEILKTRPNGNMAVIPAKNVTQEELSKIEAVGKVPGYQSGVNFDGSLPTLKAPENQVVAAPPMYSKVIKTPDPISATPVGSITVKAPETKPIIAPPDKNLLIPMTPKPEPVSKYTPVPIAKPEPTAEDIARKKAMDVITGYAVGDSPYQRALANQTMTGVGAATAASNAATKMELGQAGADKGTMTTASQVAARDAQSAMSKTAAQLALGAQQEQLSAAGTLASQAASGQAAEYSKMALERAYGDQDAARMSDDAAKMTEGAWVLKYGNRGATADDYRQIKKYTTAGIQDITQNEKDWQTAITSADLTNPEAVSRLQDLYQKQHPNLPVIDLSGLQKDQAYQRKLQEQQIKTGDINLDAQEFAFIKSKIEANLDYNSLTEEEKRAISPEAYAGLAAERNINLEQMRITLGQTQLKGVLNYADQNIEYKDLPKEIKALVGTEAAYNALRKYGINAKYDADEIHRVAQDIIAGATYEMLTKPAADGTPAKYPNLTLNDYNSIKTRNGDDPAKEGFNYLTDQLNSYTAPGSFNLDKAKEVYEKLKSPEFASYNKYLVEPPWETMEAVNGPINMDKVVDDYIKKGLIEGKYLVNGKVDDTLRSNLKEVFQKAIADGVTDAEGNVLPGKTMDWPWDDISTWTNYTNWDGKDIPNDVSPNDAKYLSTNVAIPPGVDAATLQNNGAITYADMKKKWDSLGLADQGKYFTNGVFDNKAFINTYFKKAGETGAPLTPGEAYLAYNDPSNTAIKDGWNAFVLPANGIPAGAKFAFTSENGTYNNNEPGSDGGAMNVGSANLRTIWQNFSNVFNAGKPMTYAEFQGRWGDGSKWIVGDDGEVLNFTQPEKYGATKENGWVATTSPQKETAIDAFVKSPGTLLGLSLNGGDPDTTNLKAEGITYLNQIKNKDIKIGGTTVKFTGTYYDGGKKKNENRDVQIEFTDKSGRSGYLGWTPQGLMYLRWRDGQTKDKILKYVNGKLVVDDVPNDANATFGQTRAI